MFLRKDCGSFRNGRLLPVAPGVFAFGDTVNVYVIRIGEEAVLIDCASGAVLDALGGIGVRKIAWVLLTHHHRENLQGATRMRAHGARLAAPAGERPLIDGVETFWKNPSGWSCEGAPYARPLTSPVRIDRSFSHSDVFRYGGVEIACYSTPGHTPGHMGYLLCRRGDRLFFSGDLAMAGARLINFYDSDWDYGYGAGLPPLISSIRMVDERVEPTMMLPSHGRPIRSPRAVLDRLVGKLETFREEYLRHWKVDRLSRFADSVSRLSRVPHFRVIGKRLFKCDCANMYLLLSQTGNALVVDCGMLISRDPSESWRWLDDRLADFRERYGLRRVEVMTASHYHGDHLDGLYHLASAHGTSLWALESMREVLEHPQRFNLTCLIDEYVDRPLGGLRVDRPIRDGDHVRWREFDLEFFHLPGQTWYAQGLATRVEGRSILFVGDNLFHGEGRDGHDAFVARNKVILEDGYIKCARRLLERKPDLLLNGHGHEVPKPEPQLRKLLRWGKRFRKAIEALSPYESYEYWFHPYFVSFFPWRIRARRGRAFRAGLNFENYLDRKIDVRCELRLPRGWQAPRPTIAECVASRGCLHVTRLVSVPRRCPQGRYAITADVVYDGRSLGEFPEAVVDVV
ncbi:MAG: MBL fold metallo-hydrolase [Planctomycetota bacterium]